ncbi:hypothetical protein ACFL5K_00800 [Gemmatimonadota bacterium]
MLSFRFAARFVSLFSIFLLLSGCSTGTPEAVPSAGADPGWQVIGPGGGGSTFYPTFHPTDPQRIVIRCDMTGIYLSSDGGNSWKLHNLTSSASSFAFEPGSKDVVYVGTRGLFRTDDFGESWQLIFPSPADTLGRSYSGDHAGIRFELRPGSVYPSGGGSVSAILVHPDDPGTIYTGVGGIVFISNDRGKSWREAAKLDSGIRGLFCAPENPETIYAVTANNTYLLTPEGTVTEKYPLPEDLVPATSVAAGWDADKDDLRIYAVASAIYRDGKSGGAFVSEDGGAGWQRVDGRLVAQAALPAGEVQPSFNYVATSTMDSRTAYLVCDRFIDKNPRGDTGLWYGIFKTSDGGRTWQWVYKEGGGNADYTIRDGWIAENLDDSWSSEAFGGEYVRIICTGVFPADPEVAIFTDWYRAMKTVDGGGLWTSLYSRTLENGTIESRGLDVTTTYGVHFDPFNPEHLAISYTDIAYWHSFNGGRTWTRPVEGIPPRWDNTCYWVQFDPEIKDKLWSAWGSYHDLPKLKMTRLEGWRKRAVGGVALSNDGGRSWKVTSDGLPANAPTTCLLLDPSSPAGARTLYAAVYGTGVYKSTDDGQSWKLKNKGIEQDRPNAWEVIQSADGTLYLVVAFDVIFDDGQGNRALADGALYRSTDKAESWQKVELPAGVRFPNSIEVDFENSDRLYLACWASVDAGDYRGRRSAGGNRVEESAGGVLLSEDGGKSWRQVFDPSAYVYDVTLDPRRPGRVYLVTFHYSAFFSDNYGADWQKMKGYDFHWGHRAVPDPHHPEKIYITTFGTSVWHGTPVAE